MTKVGIIGAGMVGSATANALAMRGICEEIVLIDKDADKAVAQAMDVGIASLTAKGVRVEAGDYRQLRGAKVVILAPGLRQKFGRNYRELIENNIEVFRQIVPKVIKTAPNAVLIVATQPVDVLTEYAISKLDRAMWPKVIGVGTALETLHLRAAIAERLDVPADQVSGVVIGQEGDAALVVWSSVTVAGQPLREYAERKGLEWNNAIQHEITDLVRRSSLRMTDAKGATFYGIGAMIAELTETILNNRKRSLTVSAHTERYGVSLSLPRLIGANGVLETLDVNLTSEEQLKLEALVGALADENLVA